MKEKQNLKNVVIIILLLALGGAFFYIFQLTKKLHAALSQEKENVNLISGSPHFKSAVYKLPIGPVLESQAQSNVDNFRDWHDRSEGLGVYYDSSDFSYYSTKVFPKLVNAQIEYMRKKKPYNPEKYDWKIGFYWDYNLDDDGLVKYDYCIVPVLVDKSNNKKVIDYFDKRDTTYNHYPVIISDRTAMPIRGNVYNTGTMFP